MEGEEICGYEAGRSLEYYMAGLAGILQRIRRGRGASTHSLVKEVRKAMYSLLFLAWEKPDDYLYAIASSNVPEKLRSQKARRCFIDLLYGLLRRFRETTNKMPAGGRIRLMNIVSTAIAEMIRTGVPPAGQDIASFAFSPKGGD